ncbi:heterokaryon incompatibility protein-domain-containing protein [Annulohypoxylon truncatum]|uniref:heterokaryon incompatibility protein-domain-containing protein n=1 Tax=Annulohypoxylon truncatum TaxID=327061 RepID=UPI002008C79E|nr:heterokaryon incompatibility protein-domain-containing protein [Annulohypoxylon truncatum]KAI1213284.1 heterokaryon incompatibility protein-domain-containing protein [Annulohypoxylon truncatum]
MSEKHASGSESEGEEGEPCPVCRDFDPDLAPRVTKVNQTIFSPDPFGLTLGVKSSDPDCPIFSQLNEAEVEETQAEEGSSGEPPLYEIDKSVSEVWAQAREGCKSCQILFMALFFSWKTSDAIEPDQRSEKAFQEAVQSLYLHVMLSPGRKVRVDVTTRDGGRISVSRTDVISYELFALANKPSPWNIIGRLKSSPVSVLNDQYRDFVEKWISECADEHLYCGPLTPATMPKRLLNVDPRNGDIIFLEEDIAGRAPYITLSHFWKISQPLRMTHDRLNRLGVTIHLDELSPTLRDAVRIARWLDIQYLWIDSLCIIQDDAKDWEEQSVQMGNIYRQSYFTIAAHVATNNASPTHGCFLERKHFREISHQDDSGTTCSTVVRGDFAHEDDPITPDALTGRGWCYQERLLASRIIHFRPKEITFECFAGTKCECDELLPHGSDPMGSRPYKSFKEGFAEYATIVEPYEGSAADILNGLNAQKAWLAWRDMVANYATTDFTFKADRLPALAGVAGRMPKQAFGSYVAGLWTGELVSELLWRRSFNVKRFRDKPYIAPSFAWASGSGPITWWNPCQRPGESGLLVLAKVLDVSCELATSEPFGQVRDGSIRLSGRVAPVRLRIPFLQRISWILKLSPRMRRIEWLTKASGITHWFCVKLRQFAWKLNNYRVLHPARDLVRYLVENIDGDENDTVARIAQLVRKDRPFGDLNGWVGNATSDTEEDSPRMVLENLVAIELAAWSKNFSEIENGNTGRIEVGALLLAPSKGRKGPKMATKRT